MERSSYRCISCESKIGKIVYKSVNGFQITRCSTCDLISTQPQPTPQELKEMYDKQVLSVNGASEDFAEKFVGDTEKLARAVGYTHRLKKINKFIKGTKVLEVGCAAGLFLYFLQKSGFEVLGTELSPWGFRWAKEKLKLRVFQKEIGQLEISQESLDAILMYDVLEHTTDPKLYLKQSNRLLKKGGLMVLNVPNFSSLMSKIRRDLWLKLDPPQHLFHFEKKTLTKLLENTGFKVLEIKTNTGTNQELGKQLFLQLTSAERGAKKLSLSTIYQKYKAFLQPVKKTVYFGINGISSLIGPIFNKVLVKTDLGEGIEVYATKIK